MFLVETLGLGDLVRVDVETSDVGASRILGHVGGDAAAPAAEIEGGVGGFEVDVLADEFLVEQLVLEHGGLPTHPGGDVHLLDVTQGAEMVEDPVVDLETVADLLLIIIAQDGNHLLLVGPVEVIDDVRPHEIVDLFRGEALEVAERGPEGLPSFGGSGVLEIGLAVVMSVDDTGGGGGGGRGGRRGRGGCDFPFLLGDVVQETGVTLGTATAGSPTGRRGVGSSGEGLRCHRSMIFLTEEAEEGGGGGGGGEVKERRRWREKGEKEKENKIESDREIKR